MWNSNRQLFGTNAVRYFAFGRAALACGLKRLGIGKGEKVLLPSYICETALAALHHLGIVPAFYPVHENLRADVPAIRKKIDSRTRALMAVNYFGFAQDYRALRNVCDERGLFLVEDNAHGFLSLDGTRPLGTWGDIAICSFRKHLVVPNGAALIINRPAAPGVTDNFPLERDWPAEMTDTVKCWIKEWDRRLSLGIVEGHLRRDLRRRSADGRQPPPAQGTAPETDLGPFLNRCALYSLCLLRGLSIGRFRAALRSRYEAAVALMRERHGLRPIFPTLPEGTVPRAAPAIGTDPDAAVRGLCKRGLYATTWPRLPHAVRDRPGAFPAFYRQVVIVPLTGMELLQGADPRRLVG